MKKLLTASVLLFLSATAAQANEYPSEETVRFALNCMAQLRRMRTCTLVYAAMTIYVQLCPIVNMRKALLTSEIRQCLEKRAVFFVITSAVKSFTKF